MRLIRQLARLPRLVAFAVYFARELVVANAVVAWEVITPRHHLEPGIAEVPLQSRTDAQVALLVGLVTLTPGTLALEVSTDPPVLYVHGLHVPDPDAFRGQVRRLEHKMLDAVF